MFIFHCIPNELFKLSLEISLLRCCLNSWSPCVIQTCWMYSWFTDIVLWDFSQDQYYTNKVIGIFMNAYCTLEALPKADFL